MRRKWLHRNHNKVLEDAAYKALRMIAINITNDAKHLAPWDTGRLRGSITYATKRNKSIVDARAQSGDGISVPREDMTAYIGTNVFYAPYQEYGTEKMAGKPYLRPAFDRNRKKAQKLFDKELKQAYRRG